MAATFAVAMQIYRPLEWGGVKWGRRPRGQ